MTHADTGAATVVLARVYSCAAMARRRWFARHAEVRRRLGRPVISVGNLRAGGSGKTPAVAAIAALLRDRGERPSVLSRGYGRRAPVDGAVVVSDGRHILADVDRSGDEPLMLARQLDGVAVVVSPDRYLAGRLAERRLGCTVHVLDDGFQHFALWRDADLLIVTPEDLADPRTLPAGPLREPLAAAGAADALLAATDDEAEAGRLAARLSVATVFRLRRVQGPVTLAESGGRVVQPAPGTRVLAVAGVARPAQFVSGLRTGGWNVSGQVIVRDHHSYGRQDLAAIAEAAAVARAVMAITTAKDMERLLPLRPFPIPFAVAALEAAIEPADEFEAWLAHQIETARAAGQRRAGETRHGERVTEVMTR